MPKSSTQITNIAVKYRGTIIASCSILEKEIEFFIRNFFVEDKHKSALMAYVLLDRVTFDSKIAIMEKLLKLIAPTGFKKEYGKLIGELRYIKDERNKWAHCIHFWDKNPQDNIVLVGFRDEMKQHIYTPIMYKNLIERINNSIKEINKFSKNHYEFLPAQ